MATCESPRQTYDRAFYAAQICGSARSARFVVPLLLDVCTDVHSVVDVGCGAGVWLARFKEAGVERVLGMDGGSAADNNQLEISPEEFLAANLERELPTPSRFDLCICLETAEHLSPAAAPALISSLCRLSDVIVFSAALPGQGGTHNLNERWPSYWASLFATHGYHPLDRVRANIWHDARIEWWYRQNIILFVNLEGFERIRNPDARSADQSSSPLDIVHPECFSIFKSEALDRAAGALQTKILELSAANSALVGENGALKAQADSYLDQLNLVVHSTSWKITYPLRWIVGSNPGQRRFFRRVAYLGWWIITGQLLRRLRERRARHIYDETP
jgi:SAM-dependent methyltransferase